MTPSGLNSNPRHRAAVSIARPTVAAREAKEVLTPAASEETEALEAATAALAPWARPPTRCAWAGVALAVSD
jgi:hypothetical protein